MGHPELTYNFIIINNQVVGERREDPQMTGGSPWHMHTLTFRRQCWVPGQARSVCLDHTLLYHWLSESTLGIELLYPSASLSPQPGTVLIIPVCPGAHTYEVLNKYHCLPSWKQCPPLNSLWWPFSSPITCCMPITYFLEVSSLTQGHILKSWNNVITLPYIRFPFNHPEEFIFKDINW